MTGENGGPSARRGRAEAQETADRVRILRDELARPELKAALSLSPEQVAQFDAWAERTLARLTGEFDVDTTVSQKRLSWGMRIASTLGGLAICASVVLFFMRFWGYLSTPVQIGVVILAPLLAVIGTEYAARLERTLYFAGLMALVAVTAFILNLSVLGDIFNIASTEKALLAWGAFALLLAYRYGLRLILAIGLVLLLGYGAAALTAQLGHRWTDFAGRPEHVAVLALILLSVPLLVNHPLNSDFPSVYRLIGPLALFISILSLAEWGAQSYLPLENNSVERLYEFTGLALAAASVWLGIKRNWDGIVNTGSAFFAIFLFSRLYHWWWDWMPKYLFFAVIGVIGILLLAILRLMRRERTEGLPA